MDDRIEAKLDRIVTDVSHINITLATQAVVLEEHTKRSTALENIVIPLQKKADRVEGMLQMIGMLATACMVIAAIIEVARAVGR